MTFSTHASLFTTLFFLLLTQVGLAKDPSEVEVGENFRFKIEEARPTQFAVGFREIKLRMAKLADIEDDEAALEKYLKKHRVDLVLGPGEKIYVVDGHHVTYAAQQLGYKKMYGKLVADWSKLKSEDFWKRMSVKNWVYLKDENGILRPPSELPRNFNALKDDPYRSLAWFVRKAGGYDPVESPFQEFRWAEYFREKLPPFDAKKDDQFEKAFRESMKLTHDSAAAHLPGYTPCSVRNLVNEYLLR